MADAGTNSRKRKRATATAQQKKRPFDSVRLLQEIINVCVILTTFVPKRLQVLSMLYALAGYDLWLIAPTNFGKSLPWWVLPSVKRSLDRLCRDKTTLSKLIEQAIKIVDDPTEYKQFADNNPAPTHLTRTKIRMNLPRVSETNEDDLPLNEIKSSIELKAKQKKKKKGETKKTGWQPFACYHHAHQVDL